MPKKIHTTESIPERPNTLKSICERNHILSQWMKAGLRAIENKYRDRIIVPDTKLLGVSVDFDKALEKYFSQENRWDYGFDYEGNLIFIEFHPAQTSEIERIIKKVHAISNWLKENCPEMLSLPKFENGNRQFYWVSTGSNGILGNSRTAKRLAINRIKPTGSIFNYSKIKAES